MAGWDDPASQTALARTWDKPDTFLLYRDWTPNDIVSSPKDLTIIPVFLKDPLEMPLLPQVAGSNFKNTMSTFPRGGVGAFWSFSVLWILPLFGMVGYKLLLVMARKKADQRRLDPGILF